MLILHSGRLYGAGSSRLRHDHARRPSGDTAIEAPLKELAAKHGLNPKTVAKWRKRAFVQDTPMGPKSPRSTVLTAEEEAIIVAFRKHALLPLDGIEHRLTKPSHLWTKRPDRFRLDPTHLTAGLNTADPPMIVIVWQERGGPAIHRFLQPPCRRWRPWGSKVSPWPNQPSRPAAWRSSGACRPTP